MSNRPPLTIRHVQSPAPACHPANDTLPVGLWTEMKARWLGDKSRYADDADATSQKSVAA